jgi:hypothetical protein
MRSTDRGVKRAAQSSTGASIEFFEFQVRKDRKPSDTHIVTHRRFDRWFYQHFGIRARSEAVFCVGERGRTSTVQYGDPYIIFPIGEFKYIWSPKITDLYGETSGMDFDKDEDGDPVYDPDAEVDKVLSGYGYTDKGFATAVQSRSEVMIECDRYYAFDYKIYHELLKKEVLE